MQSYANLTKLSIKVSQHLENDDLLSNCNPKIVMYKHFCSKIFCTFPKYFLILSVTILLTGTLISVLLKMLRQAEHIIIIHTCAHTHNGPACTLGNQSVTSTCKNAHLPPIWKAPVMTVTHHNYHFKSLS